MQKKSSERKAASAVTPEDIRRESEPNPLADLYQIDSDSTPAERKAVYLILRLLDNIEEYYELRGQLQDVVAADRGAEIKIIELLNALINGLRVEESILGRVDIIP